MNIILLSGGSGKRLWPLSNDIRSKQFIKLFKNERGDYESMLQRIYSQIKTVDPDAAITIAANKSQVSAIHNQLGEDIEVSIEPCHRDTFAAIALATSYLHDVQGMPEDEAVVVCPVDPYVDLSYFECIKNIYNTAKLSENNLVLMGIHPTYPSEKYGYIKPVKDVSGNCNFTFTEKPTKEKAEKYIAEGALWNGGVFSYRLSYVLNKSRELLGTSDYYKLLTNYSTLKKISFDFAVVEAEKCIEVLRYNGQWIDLGTWNTLTEAMGQPIIGNGRLNETCKNVHVINELDIPVLGMGLTNVVVCASPEGILVSDKDQSAYIKPFVDTIDQQVMFAEKSWGSYRVLEVEDESMTVKIILKPRSRMNYHSHEHRNEVWTVIAGKGMAVVADIKQSIKAGDVITIPAGYKHTVIAGDAGLQLIEIQLGKEISVTDKVKYEF